MVPVQAGAVSPLSFAPSDDATVRESRQTNNYGASPLLDVDASSRKDALLRFAMSGTGGATVSSANGADYASSEHTNGNAPELVVVTASP